MLNHNQNILIFLIFIFTFFILISCSTSIEDAEEIKIDIPGDTPINRIKLINPNVNLIGAEKDNYQVESAYIGYVSNFSDYVYGIIKIKYLGIEDRYFIYADIYYKNQYDTLIFSDWSYIYTQNLCKLTYSDLNTDTFFTPTLNTGYYFIIEDFSYYNIELSDIFSLDLEITSNPYNYIEPLGELTQLGDPYFVDSFWYLNIQNTGNIPVEEWFSQFIFQDEFGREYEWDYPLCYKLVDSKYILYGVFDINETGILEGYPLSAMNFSLPLIGWDPYQYSSENLRNFIQTNFNDISKDEKNLLIKDYLYQKTKEKMLFEYNTRSN